MSMAKFKSILKRLWHFREPVSWLITIAALLGVGAMITTALKYLLSFSLPVLVIIILGAIAIVLWIIIGAIWGYSKLCKIGKLNTAADKYEKWILKAIDLHPDCIDDNSELFKNPEIFRNVIAESNYKEMPSEKNEIEDIFEKKAEVIEKGGSFGISNSNSITKDQYIELWQKIDKGLSVSIKRLDGKLRNIKKVKFKYTYNHPVTTTLYALAFLQNVKKYASKPSTGKIHDLGIERELRSGGKGSHEQIAIAELAKQWNGFKKENKIE